MTEEKGRRKDVAQLQRELVERILDGDSLADALDGLKVNGRRWRQWIRNERFRVAVGRGVEEKELVEVVDALTLNRRAYDQLLRACDVYLAKDEGSDEKDSIRGRLDERSAKVYLAIIEAMAKRLKELSPKLKSDEEEKPEGMGALTPEEYDALARRLTEIRRAGSR